MEYIAVVVAAAAAWIVGAAWYGFLSKPWIEASQVPVNDKGQPVNGNTPTPYLISLVLILIVAGMMRHTFATSGVDTFFEGLVGGLGIGLFFITPWIALNNTYTMRKPLLTVIDGGYATIACAVMGAVLTLFGVDVGAAAVE